MAKAKHVGVLVISWNFPPNVGGMENLIAGLCKELRKTHPLFVITSYVDADTDRENWILRPGRPGLLAFSMHALIRGGLLLRKNSDIGLVLGGSAMVTPLVLALARLFRRKAIVHVHGLDLIYPSILYQFLCVRWLRHCDRVIANSRFTASLTRAKRVRGSSIHVIPPGVDSEAQLPLPAAEVKKELGLEGRKVILYVGRLTRRKGVKEFIEQALPAVTAEVPEACFVIVGDNPTDSMVHRDDAAGEIRAALRAEVSRNNVRLLGSLGDADLAKAYAVADLLVLPVISMEHDVEGFGIVVLEAAVAGKPCVATRVGGIPDAIENSKSGILIEPGDYASFSRAIINLLRNDQARSAMGEYARRRVREKFGWESIVGKYEEIFNSLAAPIERA